MFDHEGKTIAPPRIKWSAPYVIIYFVNHTEAVSSVTKWDPTQIVNPESSTILDFYRYLHLLCIAEVRTWTIWCHHCC